MGDLAVVRTATCACGQLSLQVRGDPSMHGVCHCTNCKRRTGSAFGISAYFPRSALVYIQGESQVYAFHHAPQNHEQQRHFCWRCGTTLFWFISTLSDQLASLVGALRMLGFPRPPTRSGIARRKRGLNCQHSGGHMRSRRPYSSFFDADAQVRPCASRTFLLCAGQVGR
jgi:hypothetical protein